MAKSKKKNQQNQARIAVPKEYPGGLRNGMTMTVQTRYAQKLIAGRKSNHEAGPIVGLMEFGGRVKMIWLSSEADDPYADWYLIKIEEELEVVKRQFSKDIQRLKDLMAGMEGFNIDVAQSIQPVEVALSFQNPYGYMGAYLVHDFDVLARLIYTTKHVGLFEKNAADKLIYECGSHIRRLFRLPMEWKFTGVSRSDLGLDNDQAKRAIKQLGNCPDDIVAGLKRAKLSPVVRKAPTGLAANDQNPNHQVKEKAPLQSVAG